MALFQVPNGRTHLRVISGGNCAPHTKTRDTSSQTLGQRLTGIRRKDSPVSERLQEMRALLKAAKHIDPAEVEAVFAELWEIGTEYQQQSYKAPMRKLRKAIDFAVDVCLESEVWTPENPRTCHLAIRTYGRLQLTPGIGIAETLTWIIRRDLKQLPKSDLILLLHNLACCGSMPVYDSAFLKRLSRLIRTKKLHNYGIEHNSLIDEALKIFDAHPKRLLPEGMEHLQPLRPLDTKKARRRG